MTTAKSLVLLILDGFGYSETSASNAIEQANSPVWDRLWESYPRTLLRTSGLAVGLPEGQMGNSEVGHMNLGAGRIVYQSLTRISKSIADGDFFSNAALTELVDRAVKLGKAVHLAGVLSPGGVHAHEEHFYAMLELAKQRGAKKIYVHAFLDGRDTPPRSAAASLEKLEAKLKALGVGKLVSMVGRYYAMDRDNRWERVQVAYDLLTQGRAEIIATTALDALQAAYEQDKDDEFCPPVSIRENDAKPVTLDEDDALVFMNFRPDRARQLCRALLLDDFESTLDRSVRPSLSGFVSLTDYAPDIPAAIAFPPVPLVNTLGEVIQQHGLKQLRIAETEKYPHVTFFFNGGEEAEFAGETRVLIPSPKVATYDLQPEMSAPEVTAKMLTAIESGGYDLIVCNYANCDMVGHTGDFNAAMQAVEAVDEALGQVIEAILRSGASALVTADHGNVELMRDPDTGVPVTSHTTFPVPLVYVGADHANVQLQEGVLADIAPTILSLLGADIPADMTGKVLVSSNE